ncbi:hypothetical protein BGX28_007206 [Mortierella sp. GBA30]|nr:hypothetical protein BGX28_007206 [Mortierella sp. GBA30]
MSLKHSTTASLPSALSQPSHRNPNANGHSSSPGSQTHSIVSPPNQPRRTLSTQLAPDYHDWVNDVSTNRLISSSVASLDGKTPSTYASARPPSSTSGSRFLDAVTGRSKAAKGRARRENQPSFSGSAFTNSDTEPSIGHDDVDEAEDSRRSSNINYSNKGSGPRTDLAKQSSPNDNLNTSPTPRLPPLNQSQVHVSDPSRPAFKLGTPKFSKQKLSKSRTSPSGDTPTERSALLGTNSRTRQDDLDWWTNEGSRSRTPRYNGSAVPDQDEAEDTEDVRESDSLRRPSR